VKKEIISIIITLMLLGLLFPLFTVDAKNTTTLSTKTLTITNTGTGTIQALNSNGYPIGGYGTYQISKGASVTVRT
jgi:hypothetical protein